ncbi:MAG: hypothetical protein LQ352_003338 [Teloschistes flavicans]|nr:MAG: hypothetical protein LQ352_003338 [Teloschistes flavicans]
MHYFTTLVMLVTPLFQLVVPQYIDPSTVDDATKQKWCNDQQAACPLLCLQMNASDVPASNDCTASTLAFTCVCDNGLQPNASEYSQTVPYYECTESANHSLQAQNPTRVNTSTISTMSATSTGGSSGSKETGASAVYTGFGAASTTGSSSGKSDAQSLIFGFGRSYGLAIVFIGVSAAFTFLL